MGKIFLFVFLREKKYSIKKRKVKEKQLLTERD
jgi:hypothetical protein